MSKKKEKERQSLAITTVALALMILTSWPAEITMDQPITVIAVVCYAATTIVVIVEWIKHFLRFRGTSKD